MIDLTKCTPKTLEEAVNFLYANITDDDFTFIKINGVIMLHHGFGTNMRNKWNLWYDSELAEFFRTTYGLGHADDMSSVILDYLYHKVMGYTFDIQATVDYFRDHWKQNGVDPLTLEAL